jgi:AraC-like DNA-binding protein
LKEKEEGYQMGEARSELAEAQHGLSETYPQGRATPRALLDAPSHEKPTDRVDERIRRVDWPIVLGRTNLHARAGSPRGGVTSVLSAIDELSCYQELDVVLRRAVELLRDRIGLERVALFLFQPQDRLLYGCWGTGLNGQTTDEHQIAFALGDNHREAFHRAESDGDRWLLLDNAPRTVQLDGETRILEDGWIVLTPVISARGPVGLLTSDGALSQAPVDESKQTQAAVFCSMLANLIELKRDEAGQAPARPVFRARHPRAIAQTELVSRAVELMHRLPGLERAQLAARLGTTESRLGKLFKAEMGFSVGDYRNRLRLEAFLRLVERSGGNLLEAALDAGFGSYAQFHRVFRNLLGTTPREYLLGSKRPAAHGPT